MGRKLVHELRGNRVILAGVALGVCFILVFYPLSVPGLSFSCSPWFDRSSGRVRKSHLLTPSGGRWEGLAHCHLALCCLSVLSQFRVSVASSGCRGDGQGKVLETDESREWQR